MNETSFSKTWTRGKFYSRRLNTVFNSEFPDWHTYDEGRLGQTAETLWKRPWQPSGYKLGKWRNKYWILILSSIMCRTWTIRVLHIILSFEAPGKVFHLTITPTPCFAIHLRKVFVRLLAVNHSPSLCSVGVKFSNPSFLFMRPPKFSFQCRTLCIYIIFLPVSLKLLTSN